MGELGAGGGDQGLIPCLEPGQWGCAEPAALGSKGLVDAVEELKAVPGG